MKLFARLFHELDQTNKTNEKVDALVDFFRQATDEDKLHMLALFTGRRPRRIVSPGFIRDWAAEASGIPEWLFVESYSVVGDLSETVALILPEPDEMVDKPLAWWVNYVKELSNKFEEERKNAIINAWRQLSSKERFIFNKITSSTFRVGVSQTLVIRALSMHTGIDINLLTHRLMGKWTVENTTYEELIVKGAEKDDLSKPYPFYLAYAIEGEVADLGEPHEWQAEWKWDGIRSQLIKRDGRIYIWSRGEDLVTDRFPELALLKDILPDGTVIDGEILPFRDGQVLPFSVLQTRIGRKLLSQKILKEAPAVIFAYDLIEWNGNDFREMPLFKRREILENLVAKVNFHPYLQISPKVEFDNWEQLSELRNNARNMTAEGLMLKRKSGEYKSGRKKGDWWKWKLDPYSVDAVLIYAQSGSGRRANLYTDYTFAVWRGEELVPFAKAYSGLTDKEIIEVDRWIRNNTLERFGPVRTVKAELVFEIGFEGIAKSTRHKSGIAVRFPRILRWRKDKIVAEADRIEILQSLLHS